MIICPWGFFELTTSNLEPYFPSNRWIIHAFIWNSKGVSCTLHQIGAAETWVAYRETAGAGVLCFSVRKCRVAIWLKTTAIFGSGRVRFTVTRDLQRFAIVGRHRKNMEHFVRHQFLLGSSNISWAAKGGICTSSLYQCAPGTLNNHFLMDLWWNSHFLCNDLESSSWNNHKRLVVWSSR